MGQRLLGSLPGIAALAAFVAAIALAAWLPRVVSLALFTLETGAVPEGFHLMYRTTDSRYDVASWKHYVAERDKLGIAALRLPESGGQIRPKATYTFRVLEDDGARQLVEVAFDGPYSSWSRYEAYADRVVPVAHYSSERASRGAQLAELFAILLLAALAAAGAAAGVKRLLRRPQA